jgi:hypothetical protein
MASSAEWALSESTFVIVTPHTVMGRKLSVRVGRFFQKPGVRVNKSTVVEVVVLVDVEVLLLDVDVDELVEVEVLLLVDEDVLVLVDEEVLLLVDEEVLLLVDEEVLLLVDEEVLLLVDEEVLVLVVDVVVVVGVRSAVCVPPESSSRLSQNAGPKVTSSSIAPEPSRSLPTILMSNSRLQKPGIGDCKAGMSSGGSGVNVTVFGLVLSACPVLHATGQVVVIVPSPSYSTTAPSSVHGGSSAKFESQSRSNRISSMVTLVPPRMAPAPTETLTRTTLGGVWPT